MEESTAPTTPAIQSDSQSESQNTTPPMNPASEYLIDASPKTTTAAAPVAPVKGESTFTKLQDLFGTNADLENDGAWMPLSEEVAIQVRSQQSRAARAEGTRLFKKNRALIASGTVDAKLEDQNDVELCVNSLVVDWRGFTDDDGAPIACTDLAIRDLLTRLPHLRRMIMNWSSQLENYR